jgi:aminomethyltransferase
MLPINSNDFSDDLAMKETAFTDIHRQLGGKIVEFAGFAMPVQYTGIMEEHQRVRNSVGMFDVSHMGEVEIRGKDALAFVQKITINDAGKLKEGGVQYSAMCYDDGGIVDDLLVYHMGEYFLLVINASNTAKDIAWMRQHASGDVSINDISDKTSLLAVQGPRSLDTLRRLSSVPLDGLVYYHFLRGTIAGIPAVISRTGYTGELGFELYFDAAKSTGEHVWNEVMKAGKEYQIGPAGLGARDTLRLEMGYCLYGNDIDQKTNPLEAGLGWITKPDKGIFIGQEPIRLVKKRGPSRKLVGFTAEGRLVPRHGYAIATGERQVGEITSGTFSPTLQRSIAMGYVETGSLAPGTELHVTVRETRVPLTVTPVPFLKK